jgi:hypothetical protein
VRTREHIQTQRPTCKRLNVLSKTVIEQVGMTPDFVNQPYSRLQKTQIIALHDASGKYNRQPSMASFSHTDSPDQEGWRNGPNWSVLYISFLIRLNPSWGLKCYSTDGEKVGWSLWVGFWFRLQYYFYTSLPILILGLHSTATFYNFVSTTCDKTWLRHTGTYTGVKPLAPVVQKCRTASCSKEPSWRLPARSLDPAFRNAMRVYTNTNTKDKSRKQTILGAC